MGNDTRVFYLEMTAAEILSEGGELRLSRDLMERVLVDRLSDIFTSAEPPFQYLIGIYRQFISESEIMNIKFNNDRTRKNKKKSFTTIINLIDNNTLNSLSNFHKSYPSSPSVNTSNLPILQLR
ncbi:hypothetical protein L1987_10477 [Smallanthus sonchifolius]|uniref:Uncharacterized protein n=1 Tax=Smallanthus sonchifolius TaxID=185202 RepID=A0ACB9JSA2_9ASTR|nr:hypothetical protein L1987_10477 [Smallanthus sonchifolius]